MQSVKNLAPFIPFIKIDSKIKNSGLKTKDNHKILVH